MKQLLIIPRAIWKTIFTLNFILGLIILYPAFFILLSRKEWYPKAFVLMKCWARWILLGGLIGVSIKRKISKNKIPSPCVFVSNHVSYLDIVMSYVVIPDYFVFTGKQELNKAPLFRIFFKGMNILVDRKSKMASHKAYMRANEEVDKGHSIFLFPEATINTWGQLMPFKNGAFKLAIDKQIPIVPIIYLNNWTILQNGGFFTSTGKPGISKAIMHKPVDTKGMTDADLLSLRSRVYDIIAESLKKNI